MNDLELDANTALRFELVNEVASSIDEAKSRAISMAIRLASHSQTGIRHSLTLMRQHYGNMDYDRLARESYGIAHSCANGGFSDLSTFSASSKASGGYTMSQGASRLKSIANSGIKHVDPHQHSLLSPVFKAGLTMEHDNSSFGFVEYFQNLRIGIHAMDIYTPNNFVKQVEMEERNGCPGKYTLGLLQSEMGFSYEDEDAVSYALTATRKLLERISKSDFSNNLGPNILQRIGRLEVGSESNHDRSKAIKTYLMRLAEEYGIGNDLSGVDNVQACYGGTAALLNSTDWCAHQSMLKLGNSRHCGLKDLAIVVCVDIADFGSDLAFINGGSAVVMLVGPGAPLEILPEKGYHMIDTWDFFKPPHSEEPVMPNPAESVDCYMTCLKGSYRALVKQIHEQESNHKANELDPTTLENDYNLDQSVDYFVSHATSTYLIKRAYKCFCELSYQKSASLTLKEQLNLHEVKTDPGTKITKRIGSTYTASTYTNLFSLLAVVGYEKLVNKTICVYSYGSGAAACMYRIRAHEDDKNQHFKNCASVFTDILDKRTYRTPQECVEFNSARLNMPSKSNYEVSQSTNQLPNVYYLKKIDEWGRREYELKN